ncbi:MAG: GIY-YIG nuclease family protein [Candidatus Absconditabacterales bacterium]
MVRCSDDTLYTGITNDLDKRIYDHNFSKIGAKYTKYRRPVTLVWYKRTVNKKTASKLEFKIKKVSKPQKEALIKK